jgi:hypothetical protein
MNSVNEGVVVVPQSPHPVTPPILFALRNFKPIPTSKKVAKPLTRVPFPARGNEFNLEPSCPVPLGSSFVDLLILF